MKKCRVASQGALTARARRYCRKVWSREKERIRRGGRPHLLRFRLGKLYMMRVAAPIELGLHSSETRNPTVEFLLKIRDHSRTRGLGLHLDFSSLQKIYPAGAVLLLAEIHRAVADRDLRVQITRPKDAIVNEVLQQIGIYERFGVQCDTLPNHESVIHWRSATGVLSDGETGGSLLLNYEGRLAEGITRGLYDGIVEAMTNTVHHAYDGSEGEELKRGIGRRWWMLSQEKDGKLTVAICDLGIGIPKSLPRSRSFRWADVKTFWDGLGLDRRDASAIRVALEIGKTRTGIEGRGMGLADIVRAVNLSPDGGVHIFSNKGSFASANGNEYAHNHTRSIRGTLINWQVPIAE